jgi:NAD(P)-dependent dehydrogenase (short-subunit alcohol dehydrogenase family)
MKLSNAVCVVTGGASGIGRALCERFAREGATVVVADRDLAGAQSVAQKLSALALACDVSREEEIAQLIKRTLEQHGRIDLFASNAGVAVGGGPEAPDADWKLAFDVNFMSHVWAARHVLPSMLERGNGYLLATASAAGLLTSPGAAPYAASKHAAVAFAEWLSITYGSRGIRVSCLCPQGVRTAMLELEDPATRAVRSMGRVLEPDAVAEETVRCIEREQFLILPHAEVGDYVNKRAGDRDGWLRAMRKLNDKLMG